MSVREKTIAAIKRQRNDYIPFEFDLCPSLYEQFKKKTGAADVRTYYKMPYFFFVAENYGKKRALHEKYFDNLQYLDISDFGVGFRHGTTEHFTHIESPMKNFTELEEFKNFPYPDPINDYNWEKAKKLVETVKANDMLAVASMAITIFETAWYLRGMEETLMDMVCDDENLLYHFDRITEIRCEMARQYCMAGIDVLHIGDDIATQLNMMFSMEVYRKWLKPRLKRVIDAAKEVNPNIIIDYHSDGNCEAAIEDLIEIGIDVLNPVQPECMNAAEIKKKYGSRLSFRGTIGTQTTMPFGSPQDVMKEVETMIETVGKNGGLILAPSHLLEPEVPFENIEAFISAVRKFNND